MWWMTIINLLLDLLGSGYPEDYHFHLLLWQTLHKGYSSALPGVQSSKSVNLDEEQKFKDFRLQSIFKAHLHNIMRMRFNIKRENE